MAKKINKEEQEVAPIKREEEVKDIAPQSETAPSDSADDSSVDTETKSETAPSDSAGDSPADTGAKSETLPSDSADDSPADTAPKSETAPSDSADDSPADTEAKSETPSNEGANKDKENKPKTEVNTSLGAIAKDIFANHQDFNTLWLTSDGQAFAEECYALDHSKNLKDKTVSKFVRTNA